MVQDSRSASYPGAAIASSYDFGSIDFVGQGSYSVLPFLTTRSPFLTTS